MATSYQGNLEGLGDHALDWDDARIFGLSDIESTSPNGGETANALILLEPSLANPGSLLHDISSGPAGADEIFDFLEDYGHISVRPDWSIASAGLEQGVWYTPAEDTQLFSPSIDSTAVSMSPSDWNLNTESIAQTTGPSYPYLIASPLEIEQSSMIGSMLEVPEPVPEVPEPVPEVFTCQECGSAFTVKQNLNRHMRTIHGPWTMSHCSEDGCGYKTPRKDNLPKHLKSQHGKNTVKAARGGASLKINRQRK